MPSITLRKAISDQSPMLIGNITNEVNTDQDQAHITVRLSADDNNTAHRKEKLNIFRQSM